MCCSTANWRTSWRGTSVAKKKVKLYLHGSKEDDRWNGKNFGLSEAALENFIGWGYEVAFDAEVDMETGDVKLLKVNGHKIQY